MIEYCVTKRSNGKMETEMRQIYANVTGSFENTKGIKADEQLLGDRHTLGKMLISTC